MTEIYGVDAQLYNNLPPEDQAAIRSGWADRQAEQRPVDVSGSAERVLDVPRYEATAALVDEFQDISPENAQQILQEIRSQEPDRWLDFVNSSALNDLRGTSYPERGLRVLADAIALEHAAGNLDAGDIAVLFGPGIANAGPQQASGSQLLLGASNSPEMQAFERAMADHAMELLGGSERRSAKHGNDTVPSGIADNIVKGLGNDFAGRQALAEAYAAIGDAGQREHVLDLLSDKNWVGASHDPMHNPDALGVLIRSVAERYGSSVEAGEVNLAVELVNWAGHNQDAFIKDDIFGTSSSGPRAEALALLTSNHADAILTDLTDGYDNSDQYAGDDARVLGFLLSLTSSNPNNIHAERVTRALDAYIDGQVEQVRDNPATDISQDAVGRLEILAPALLIAESAPYLHNLASNEARVDGILRVLDVVSTTAGLIPGGNAATFIAARYGDINSLSDDQIKTGLREYLSDALSGSPAEREAALSEVVDMVDAQIRETYGDVPEAARAMSRRLEDNLYEMLVAIANDNVSGFLETLELG